MQVVRKNKIPFDSLVRLSFLAMLLVALAAHSSAVTQQREPARSEKKKYADAYTSYRMINLAPGLLATIPRINEKGQVAFSMQATPGATGYFYNGSIVRNIGTLGGKEVLAVDLNDRGQVTGSSTTRSGVKRAFVWSAAVGIHDIGDLPKTNESEGIAINDRGVVTGASNGHAFRWSAKTGLEELCVLTAGGANVSFGKALNYAGAITGASQTHANNRQVFLWTPAGGFANIDSLKSSDSIPVAISPKGEVAGNRVALGGSALYRPFLWTRANGMVDLGILGGTEAAVVAMTPSLHITGLINFADGTQQAMSWTRAKGMRKLGTLGGASSGASDINTKGQIVGYAQNKAGEKRAFIWTTNMGMSDLNEHLYGVPATVVLDAAVSINDSGVIVATSNAGLVLLRPFVKQTVRHIRGPERPQP